MIEKDDRVFTLKFNQLVWSWNIMNDKEKIAEAKRLLDKMLYWCYRNQKLDKKTGKWVDDWPDLSLHISNHLHYSDVQAIKDVLTYPDIDRKKISENILED